MTTPVICARLGRAAAKPSGRRLRIAGGTAALAGTALVVATVGCGPSRTLAPGQPHAPAVPAACARPGSPLGAGQLRAAYQAPPLSAGTATGAGTVIAVIIPAPAPHLAGDLAAYSRRYGLPAPRVRGLRYGSLPAPPPAGSADAREVAAWQEEGTADLEMAHALAPRAALAWLAVSPAAGPPGMPGPAYDPALAWLVTRFRVTVVSYSSGIPEAWYRSRGYRPITASRTGLKAAARAGVTIVAAAGDYGPAEPGLDGALAPGVAWPASDPLATAVGGTRLIPSHGGYASAAFTYARSHVGPWAGGGGPSAIFARPPWQDPAVGPHRAIADIAMNASPCSPAAIYATTPGARPGWTTFAGTSIAAPLFAGLVADAAQAAGHPLGVLGPALYQMHGPADGLTDITAGTSTLPGHPGYPARPGYDLPTGIGTITSVTLFTTTLATRKARAPSRLRGQRRPARMIEAPAISNQTPESSRGSVGPGRLQEPACPAKQGQSPRSSS